MSKKKESISKLFHSIIKGLFQTTGVKINVLYGTATKGLHVG